MADENYKAQVSVKFGRAHECMLNLRAQTVDELDTLAREAAEKILGGMLALAEEAHAISNIGQQFPGTAGVSQSPGNGPESHAGGQTGPGVPQCKHGPRQHREGPIDRATGRPQWTGWFCPRDRNDPDRCKPEYER